MGVWTETAEVHGMDTSVMNEFWLILRISCLLSRPFFWVLCGLQRGLAGKSTVAQSPFLRTFKLINLERKPREQHMGIYKDDLDFRFLDRSVCVLGHTAYGHNRVASIAVPHPQDGSPHGRKQRRRTLDPSHGSIKPAPCSQGEADPPESHTEIAPQESCKRIVNRLNFEL